MAPSGASLARVHRRLRIIGVLAVAILATTIPALASGASKGAPAGGAHSTIECPNPTTGSTGTPAATPLAASSKHSKSPRRRHKRRAKHRGSAASKRRTTLLCPSPCPETAAEACTPRPPCIAAARGATGAAGEVTLACPPFPCVAPVAGGSGETTAATPACGPIGCPAPYVVTSGGPSGPTGATSPCEPPPCIYGATTGSSGTALECLPGPCPLTATAGTAAPGTTGGAAAGTAACPPLPECPLPGPGAPTAPSGTYACPEIAAGITGG